jgi:hypothetical protein
MKAGDPMSDPGPPTEEQKDRTAYDTVWKQYVRERDARKRLEGELTEAAQIRKMDRALQQQMEKTISAQHEQIRQLKGLVEALADMVEHYVGKGLHEEEKSLVERARKTAGS